MSGLACELVIPQKQLETINENALNKQFARTPYVVSFRTGRSPIKKPKTFIQEALMSNMEKAQKKESHNSKPSHIGYQTWLLGSTAMTTT